MDHHNTTKYTHVISSGEQHGHAEEKESLMLRARLSEETDSTLLEHVNLHDVDHESGFDKSGSRRHARLRSVWLWALHAGLFFMSLMFFILGATMGPTTRAYVHQFSAYCELSSTRYHIPEEEARRTPPAYHFLFTKEHQDFGELKSLFIRQAHRLIRRCLTAIRPARLELEMSTFTDGINQQHPR